MSEHRRVLNHFHKRILASVSRSSLLKATVARTGRLLDGSRFEIVADGLSDRFLHAVAEDDGMISVDLRLQRSHGRRDFGEDGNETRESHDDKVVREHRQIYDALDRRMRRFAELVKRETGVHSLWLGYPLLYAVAGEKDAQWILAPTFLWPVSIQLDHRREGRVRIGRDRSAGPVRFNRAMATWISRQLGFELRGPDEDLLERFSWTGLNRHLESLARQFRDPPHIACDAPLEPVPNKRLLNPKQSPRFFNSAVLGIYRWQNEALLSDLDNLSNRDQVGGVVSGFTSGARLPRSSDFKRPPEADRYQVYPADFSQERVIWQARNQPGVLVHGPPGTGKSQTIVNIIADALAHGRTVLMACQKQAATRVVFERLKQVGLDDLCLEVTDSERSRLPVFRAIRNQVESLPKFIADPSETQRERLAREITHLENELDQYSRALHERDAEIGLPYRTMKTIEGTTYSKFPNVRPLPSVQPITADMPFEQLDALKREIEECGRLFATGRALNNPWRFHQPALQVTSALKSDVPAILADLRELDSRHADQTRNSPGTVTRISGDLSDFRELATQIAEVLQGIQRKSESVRVHVLRTWVRELRTLSREEWSRHRAACETAAALAKTAAASSIDDGCREKYGNLPDQQQKSLWRFSKIAMEYESRWWRWVSPRFRAARRGIREIRKDADDLFFWETVRQVMQYKAAVRVRDELSKMNQRLVPGLRPRGNEQSQLQFPAVALDEFTMAEWLCRQADRHVWLNGFLNDFSSAQNASDLDELHGRLQHSLSRLPLVQEVLESLGQLEAYLQEDAFAEPEELIRAGQSIGPWLDAVESGLDRLQSFMAWKVSRRQHSEPLNSIIGVLEEYESRRVEGDRVPFPPSELPGTKYGEWWLALVEYSASLAWQSRCHQKHPILVTMTPDVHAQKVEELDSLIREKRNLEADAIRSTWLQAQVAHRDAPWKRMFQFRKSKYGDAKRLREAVELSLPEGLLAMRPCWLVNPATASELFPLREDLFDVVIFDEASQCPIEQAVPLIFRGKMVVVSGDEKQLPPTSFFSSTAGFEEADGDSDDTDETATDEVVSREQHLQKVGVDYLLQAEDLLAAAIGNLPEQFLTVHYRSRHPDLIEFSNRAFYNGRLEAPPAQVSSVNGYRPIRYHDVNGLYERRTNRDEAGRVVELLREKWFSDGENPTIGVVTFNQPQRDLIEDLLEEECNRDRDFAACYERETAREEDNQDVGFFVRNLENVQGDERDWMIFSTTFGRDETRRFYRRFGPVGTAGGERRLNVAVTRAKQQVIVVGSMPIPEVSTALSTDLAPGSQLTPAGYLQLYLAYAKAVSDGNRERIEHILERVGRKSPRMSTGDPDSPFEEDVRSVVEKLGFQVHAQVGDSGFRIDLAILAPDPKQGYLLGIECDGAAYHSDRSARLRDVWREQILRERGWRLHRIWSTRWWYHRAEEIESLKIAIDKAQARLERTLCVETLPAASTQAVSFGTLKEPWEMTPSEWKQRCDELRKQGDEEAVRAMGGLGTDFAHHYRVEQALKQGKAVPQHVLDEYPDLHPTHQPQRGESG